MTQSQVLIKKYIKSMLAAWRVLNKKLNPLYLGKANMKIVVASVQAYWT